MTYTLYYNLPLDIRVIIVSLGHQQPLVDLSMEVVELLRLPDCRELKDKSFYRPKVKNSHLVVSNEVEDLRQYHEVLVSIFSVTPFYQSLIFEERPICSNTKFQQDFLPSDELS